MPDLDEIPVPILKQGIEAEILPADDPLDISHGHAVYLGKAL
jgi:hypothetical protein